MGKINSAFFSNLEHSLKSYRQFAQKNLISESIDITFDQWLVMQTLHDNPGLNQREVASMVFKDAASLTRIVELLLKKAYLERKVHEDKRRSRLKITSAGSAVMKKAFYVISDSREKALMGIEDRRIKKLRKVLSKIIENCS